MLESFLSFVKLNNWLASQSLCNCHENRKTISKTCFEFCETIFTKLVKQPKLLKTKTLSR